MNHSIDRSDPKLSLVGAGPGDPDLISVKGLKVLAEADVVLYDALVSIELLKYAPSKAGKIYVGKRAGMHSHDQEQINQMIVHHALTRGHVVRLKGGDPFVFGRGHEEIKHAQAFGIETQVVPGISSVAAVPALQEIPLTKRGLNESFWVITGTTTNGSISTDLQLAARSTATVVILMGMKRLAEITKIFVEAGKGDTAAAIIQKGSLPDERIVTGKVSNIARRAEADKLKAPALIVIGDVVELHPRFNHELIDIERTRKFDQHG